MHSLYLHSVVNQQNPGLIVPTTALTTLNPLIYKWAGKFLLQTQLSGSHAKGTAVKCCADVDIFISLSPMLNMSLADIYEDLFLYFQNLAGFAPRKQNVSIRVTLPIGTVDLVPGRRQNASSTDHSLHLRKRHSWTQTNIDTHIRTVTAASKADIIKLVKIWRERQNIDFPSLYLELSVIEATLGRYFSSFENEFRYVMAWLHDNIETKHIVDPANTNNVLSSDLTAPEKRAIKLHAGFAATTRSLPTLVW